MKRYAALSSLLAVTLFSTGFNWPFPSGNACRDAKRIIIELSPQAGEQKRKEAEKRVAELCPTGPAGHYLKGLTFERSGNVDAAISEYRETLSLDPEFYPASGNLGLLHLQKGAGEEAAVELAAGLKTGDPRYHAGLARVMADKQMHLLAIFHYNEAIAAFSDDAALYTGIAASYNAAGQKQKAEDAYRRALVLQPENAQARFGLGTLLLERGEADKAVGELKLAAIAQPANKEIHRLLAEAYARKGDAKSADYERGLAGIGSKQKELPKVDHMALAEKHRLAKEYEMAISEYRLRVAEEPDDAVAQQRLGDTLLAVGREDEAMSYYRDALRNKGENPELHFNLAGIYERKALLDEAVVEYRQVLASSPDKQQARQRLADIYTLRGSFNQALEQYQALIKTNPADPALQLKLARAYVNSKEIDAAAGAYQAALKLDGESVDAHRELANLQRKRNMIDEAAVEYQEVLRLKKDDQEVRTALTAIYVKNKNYDALAKLLKDGVDLSPNDPNAHYKLGLVYEFQKDYDAATAQYKEAVTLKPDHAKALNAMGRVQMKDGHIAEAKESLEAARKADPDLEEAQVLLSNIKDEFNPEPRSYRKHKSSNGSKAKGKKGKKGKEAKKSKKDSADKPAKKSKKKKSKKKSKED
ncbi:tetratricopeptide repeat protein [Citrifermentans bremense]|uniref:tetratricopeptide repeat protein n=1 Tax=Citrifermentans bremense TaxID=60035 RepID=UPI000422A5EB|nr:tetratricopeptide repeat protein [Citrifermentans bremense]